MISYISKTRRVSPCIAAILLNIPHNARKLLLILSQKQAELEAAWSIYQGA
jgi:hypothetical protein